MRPSLLRGAASCAALLMGTRLPLVAHAMPLSELATFVNATVEGIVEPDSPGVTTTDLCVFSGSGYASAKTILDCLGSLPMIDEIKEPTIDYVYKLLDGLYAYGDLIRNTTDTPDQNIGEDSIFADWVRVDQAVDWVAEIDRIRSTDYDLIFDFEVDISRLLASFNDAHTEYQATQAFPFALRRPFDYRSFVDEVTNSQVFQIVPIGYTAEYNVIQRAATFEERSALLVASPPIDWVLPEPITESSIYKTITSINGKDPLEYLLGRAARKGMKSPGARLNAYLAGNNLYFVELDPEEMAGPFTETYVFEDGSSLTVELVGMCFEEITGAEWIYNRALKPQGFQGEFVDFVTKLQAAHEPDILDVLGLEEDATVRTSQRLLPLSPVESKEGQTRQDDAVSCPALDTPCAHLQLETESGRLYGYGDVPVLHLTTFNLNDMEVLTPFTDLVRAAFAYGEASQSSRIVIDVSGNGGGSPVLAVLLQRLLIGEWDTLEKLCTDYDMPITPLIDQWNSAFGLPPAADVQYTEVEMTKWLRILDVAFEYIKKVHDEDQWLIDFLDERVSVFKGFDFFMMSLEEQNKQVASFQNALYAWYTFAGRLEAGATIEPAQSIGMPPFTSWVTIRGEDPRWYPNSQQYYVDNATTWARGGVSRKYTMWSYLDACPIGMDLYANVSAGDWPVYQFTDIEILTDGNCGSACSTFVSKLSVHPFVTVISHGGVYGEVLDSSSFAGGSVKNSDDVMRELYRSLAVAAVMFPPFANPEFNETLQFVPIPTMVGIPASLNYGQEYLFEAGPSTLPQEFYIKPADMRRNEWYPELTYQGEGSSQGVDQLYTLLANGI